MKEILTNPSIVGKLELAFVWNRTFSRIEEDLSIPRKALLENLDDFPRFHADLIVEVAHPTITVKYGPKFLEHANFYVGSPTIFADKTVEDSLRNAAEARNGFGIYIPCGALWGAKDIQKMRKPWIRAVPAHLRQVDNVYNGSDWW